MCCCVLPPPPAFPPAPANVVGFWLYFSYPLLDLPYPISNRLGNRKDAPLIFVPLLLDVAVSSDIIAVLVTWLLPTKNEEGLFVTAWLLLLCCLEFVLLVLALPQKEDGGSVQEEEEDDETEEREEEEDALAATDMAKILFVLAVVVVVGNVDVDRLDAAAPTINSNNSPNPATADQLFHSTAVVEV